MSGRSYQAALIFIATSLAGCSLAEQVIVIEHRIEHREHRKIERRKEAARPTVKPYVKPSRSASIASGPSKCARTGECPEEAIPKSYSARYDSGPVLKPIRKTPENRPAEARESSAFVSAVKNWIKTGMQLPGWAGSK